MRLRTRLHSLQEFWHPASATNASCVSQVVADSVHWVWWLNACCCLATTLSPSGAQQQETLSRQRHALFPSPSHVVAVAVHAHVRRAAIIDALSPLGGLGNGVGGGEGAIYLWAKLPPGEAQPAGPCLLNSCIGACACNPPGSQARRRPAVPAQQRACPRATTPAGWWLRDPACIHLTVCTWQLNVELHPSIHTRNNLSREARLANGPSRQASQSMRLP
jgi:hypothetical protein